MENVRNFLLSHTENEWLRLIFVTPLGPLYCWLLFANVTAFLLFGVDKWKAKRKARNPRVMRIRERTLFLWAIVGGSVGAILGMRFFHHKTLHLSFRLGLPLILLLQCLLAVTAYIRL